MIVAVDIGGLIIAAVVVGWLLWIVAAILVGQAASRKNRSFWSFFFISYLAGPLVAGAIVAALPRTAEWMIAKGRWRACPMCAEAIWPQALVCPHCRVNLRAPMTAPPRPGQVPARYPVR